MYVDSNGNPVSEGTWGLYAGNQSARVERTMINPIEDDEYVQRVITEGGYFVSLGDHGVVLCSPNEFTSVSRPDVVLAQNGDEVHEGDTVELNTYPSALKEYAKTGVTIQSLYPVGALQATVCASIKEKAGMAPDGGYPITWGSIKSVLKRAAVMMPFRSVQGSTDTSELAVHDYVQFTNDSGQLRTGFIRDLDDAGSYDASVWMDATSDANAHGQKYYIRRSNIKQVWSFKEGPWPTPAGFVYKGDTVHAHYASEDFSFTLARAQFNPDGVSKKGQALVLSVGTWVHKPSKPYSAYYASIVTGITPAEVDVDTMPAIALGDLITFIADDGEPVSGTVVDTEPNDPYDGIVTLDTDTETYPAGSAYFYKNTNVVAIIRDGELIYTANNNSTTTEDTTTIMAKTTNNATGTDATALHLQTLAGARGNKAAGKVTVVQEGTQIILPDRGPASTLRGAITELQRRAEQEEMDVNVMELIDGYPLDAAYAFIRALETIFGWVNALPTPGFFGPEPPTMIGIDVDADGHTVQIPWGKIGIPGVSGKLATGIHVKDGCPTFCIQGTIKQRDKKVVNEIATFARGYLKENSLYRGKAVRVRFPEAGKAWSPLDHQPKFINTANVRSEELIFSKDVEKRISVNVWTPIVANGAVRAARVPLKRGVLLYGRYGVGKTLLATVTAQMAVKNGITFLDLDDSKQLPEAIRFARTIGGMVVVFAEDIDRCDENGSRTDAFNNILNTVDGLTSKTDEVLVVYTTNHIERISKAMLRQGRIDKVIEIREPDAEAACRLIRLYARHMLDRNENIDVVGAMIAEQKMIPAAIREIVEQSKLAAIERGDVHKITSADLTITVEDTRAHNELLKETPVDDRSELERMGDALGRRVGDALANVIKNEGADIRDVNDYDDSKHKTVVAGLTQTVQDATSRRGVRKTAA